MDRTGSGIFGRLGERVLGWVALGLLIMIGIAIWRMDPVVKTAIWQGIWRTVFWVLIVAALPWSSRFFMRRILEIGSNWAGVGVIAAFVLVDLVVGLVLMTGCEASIEAKRQIVAEATSTDSETPEEAALPAVPSSADATDIVREKTADFVEDLADRIRPADDDASTVAPSEQSAAADGQSEADTEQDGSHGGWFWFACLAALAVAGTYNYLVTEYLAEMAGG